MDEVSLYICDVCSCVFTTKEELNKCKETHSTEKSQTHCSSGIDSGVIKNTGRGGERIPIWTTKSVLELLKHTAAHYVDLSGPGNRKNFYRFIVSLCSEDIPDLTVKNVSGKYNHLMHNFNKYEKMRNQNDLLDIKIPKYYEEWLRLKDEAGFGAMPTVPNKFRTQKAKKAEETEEVFEEWNDAEEHEIVFSDDECLEPEINIDEAEKINLDKWPDYCIEKAIKYICENMTTFSNPTLRTCLYKDIVMICHEIEGLDVSEVDKVCKTLLVSFNKYEAYCQVIDDTYLCTPPKYYDLWLKYTKKYFDVPVKSNSVNCDAWKKRLNLDDSKMMSGDYFVKVDHHCSNILRNLLKNESCADVTLTAEGRTVKAHRIILSTASTYFNDVLSNAPNVYNNVLLQNVKYDILVKLIQFIYCGEIDVHPDDLESFIETAHLLQITSLYYNDQNIATFLSKFEQEISDFSIEERNTPKKRRSPSPSSGRKSVKREHFDIETEIEDISECDSRTIKRKSRKKQEVEFTKILKLYEKKTFSVKCTYCQTTLDKNTRIEKHVSDFHPYHPVFQCHDCRFVFLKKGQLNNHKKICQLT